MNNLIKIKTPAKINLTLEILDKRQDGFHNIQSVMQAVSLFDYITISMNIFNDNCNSIEISGNSCLIPYDNTNIAYIAAEKFLEAANLKGKEITIYIEKNIPVAAGLAGGSSNAAGVLFGMNKLSGEPLNSVELDKIASEIGSDVNFCLHGGTQIATSRGELLHKISTPSLKVAIAKPKELFISAKEAYQKYSALMEKPSIKNTDKIVKTIEQNNPKEIAKLLNNDLETAIIPDYIIISTIKEILIKDGALNAIMSGSGSSVFAIYENEINLSQLTGFCDVFKVESINYGVTVA